MYCGKCFNKGKKFLINTKIFIISVLIFFILILPGSIETVFAFTPPTIDGKLDDIYRESGTVTRYTNSATYSPTGQSNIISAYLYVLEDANYIYIFYYQDMYYENDNSYGANSIHWESRPSGMRGFGDIHESDKGEFIFEDAGGNIEAHFYADQITAQSGTPSGYANQGFNSDDGDGAWLAGDPANQAYIEITSVMDYNLNQTGYCSGGSCSCGSTADLLVDSPLADGSYNTVEAACDEWQWYNGWEMRVDKQLFGVLGFGVVIGNHHNSPTKTCQKNKDCPTDLSVAVSSIGDRIWYDTDGDGIQDAGEPGLQGVKINLIDPRDGNIIESQYTGADGDYIFGMLSNQYYIVQVDESTLPPGFSSTTVDTGGDYHDSYVNSVCGSDCIQRDGQTYTRIYYIDLEHEDEYRTGDFGYRPTGSAIGDYVWSDADNDGSQDDGEPGINNVELELLDDSGSPLGVTTTTNAAGWYLFTGLSAGDYKVRVASSNFNPGGALEGYSLSSGPQSSTNPTSVIQLGDDEQFLNADFGYYQSGLGSIGDFIWYDSDNDGAQDAGEEGLGNVTLDLYIDSDQDGEIDSGEPVIASAVTDTDGNYSFNGLVLDEYYLVKVTDLNDVLNGFEITTYDFTLNRYNDPYPVNLTAASPVESNADFGYNRDGSIGDTVWFDWNQDGIKDSGEVGVVGVTVELQDGSCSPSVDCPTTTTDSAGNYLFIDLAAGSYSIQITMPAGYSLSAGTPNNPHNLSISGNESYLDADFGLWRNDLYTIGDIIWEDSDADGFQDAGESGIAGVTLSLFEDSDGDGFQDPTEPLLGAAITDSNGNYTFYGVTNGDYLVIVTDEDNILAGYSQTAGLNPYPVTISSASRDDIDFGYARNLATAIIGDYVWYDIDGAGDQDVTEGGIANVLLNLYEDTNGNETYDSGIDQLLATSGTGLDGSYLFTNLLPGTYFVTVDSTNFNPGKPLEGMTSTTGGETSGAILLSEGETDLATDFGYRGTAFSIGDDVWSDNDQDGIQDEGEPGIGGVVMELLDGFGTPLGVETSTLADGSYLFYGLTAGSYQVRVKSSNFDPGGSLDGYTVTSGPQSEGSDTSRTVTFINDGDPSNDSVNNVDFGYYKAGLGSIGSFVWFDNNSDGDYDGGESGLFNVTVDLIWDLNGNGTLDPAEPIIATDTTDSAGNYQFSGLKLDDDDGDSDFDYLVTVSDRNLVLTGMEKTFGTPHTDNNSQVDPYAIALSSGLTTAQYADFGYFGPPGSIGNFVWYDSDNNGLQDAGESGIQGVTVNLYRDVDGDGVIDAGIDNKLQTKTTNSIGSYLFSGLSFDSYIVEISDSNFNPGGVLEGYSPTLQNQGGDDTVDSDGDTVLYTADITISSSNANDTTVDFGFFVAGTSYSVGNLVWEDTNNDGHRDVSEDGIDNITIVLYRDLDADGILDPEDPLFGETTTDSSGYYTFENLLDGAAYMIKVTDNNNLLTGYTKTTGVPDTDDESQDDPYPVTLSGSNVSYADFGFRPPPTLAIISSFRAYESEGQVVVEWDTESEHDTAGFYLLRFDEFSGKYKQLNRRLLPGLLTSPQGGTYSLIDKGASPGRIYTYMLIEVEGKGTRLTYGPFTISVGGESATGASAAQSLGSHSLLKQRINPGSSDSTGNRSMARVSRYIDNEGTLVVNIGRALSKNLYESDEEQITGYRRKARGVTALRQSRTEAGIVSQTESVGFRNGRRATKLKIPVSKDGLYYMDATEISDLLGISRRSVTQLIKRGRLALSSQGTRVAYIPAENGEGIFFYGQGSNSIFTLKNIYWLREGRGLWIKEMLGAQPGNHFPAYSAAEHSTFTENLHIEEDRFTNTALFTDPGADYWSWEYVIGGYPGLDSRVFTFEIHGVADVTEDASLTVYLIGSTESGSNPDHRVLISLNGTPIGEGVWDGREQYELTLHFSQDLLLEGQNTLQVRGELNDGIPYSIFYIDSFDVTYQRFYEAVDNKLVFSADANSTVTVTGFTSPDIWVFDITEPVVPIMQSATTIEESDGAYSVTLLPSSSDSVYLAVTADAAYTVDNAWPDEVSRLSSRRNRADYIIIAPASLKDAAQSLSSYRAAQGMITMVISLEDILDEFNHGNLHPEAVRDFLRFAYTNWRQPPQYVVFLGEGSYDYRNLLGHGDSMVPTLMVSTPFGLFPSDNALADVDGDGVPDIATGRIPVISVDELSVAVEKIITYENSFSANIIMLADDPDEAGQFDLDSDVIASRFPSGYTIEKIYLPYSDMDSARQFLIDNLSYGAIYMNYIGHASVSTLAGEGLLRIEDVESLTNISAPPVFTAQTCVVGQFAIPGYDSLSEKLVVYNNGGASAVWAASGMSFNDQAKILGENFYSVVFDEGYNEGYETLGGAILKTMQVYGGKGEDSDMLYLYNLLGDPALRLP
jgi:hypothetical protein